MMNVQVQLTHLQATSYIRPHPELFSERVLDARDGEALEAALSYLQVASMSVSVAFQFHLQPP